MRATRSPLALGHPTGTETLTTQIFVLTQDLPAKYNRAAAAGGVLALIALACVWVQRTLVAKRDFTTVSGKATQPRLIDLGRWKWAALAFNLLYLFYHFRPSSSRPPRALGLARSGSRA